MTLPPSLRRQLRIIAFDWDGTAVESRAHDASSIRVPIESLLRSDVWVVVASGTNFRNVDSQFSSRIPGVYKRNLYLATNRGSEIYAFDARSRPKILWMRVATPEEEQLLTEIADATRAEIVAITGLEIGVVYDRMNRRKIDLIPLERWRDPPKTEIAALIEAVETRLVTAGLRGGLREAFSIAERIARAKGLAKARITTDVKHIEIGLTDKADSMVWMMRELAEPRGVEPGEILIAGDEFGPIAGFPGSDSKMMIPATNGAIFVSVGKEPNGVPPNVLHLGGGPERLHQILTAQAELHSLRLPAAPTSDTAWALAEDGFVLSREHEIESIFTVTNGYVGTRGSLAERSALSSPATFVAGVYDTGPDGIPELRHLPDWTYIHAEIDGTPLVLEVGRMLSNRRVLDMKQGILWRKWLHRDPSGRVTNVRGLRLASQGDRHIVLQSLSFTPENYGGTLTIEGSFLRSIATTTERGVTAAFAVASVLERPDGGRAVVSVQDAEHGIAPESWKLDVQVGKTYRFDRIFSVSTSRDGERPLENARKHLDQVLERQGIDGLMEAHLEAWRGYWRAADVRIEGDEDAQRALRFAIYHLLSAANPDDDRVSVAARGLTGSAYKGHVFWETEIFLVPFYLATLPAAARALVMYRYHTLDAARAKATRLGYRGALFAWESADTGEDVTPSRVITPDGEIVPIRVGTEEQHISADVAWAAWTCWQATGDDSFLLDAGAEILLETARFWASRVEPGRDGLFHIRQVIGPDEYHESVDDDAYTNGMAQWNLERGAEVAALLAKKWPDAWRTLAARLDLGPEEVGEWPRIAGRMYTGLDPSTGLIEQFAGYYKLEEIELVPFDRRVAPMDVLLGHERIQRTKVVKQPDVMMLINVLWDRFPAEIRMRNFRYYDPRTDHGSSLGPPIHALIAARLGDLPLAERYFRRTAEIDLADNMGNAAGGVHMGAAAGLWQAAVFGFAGLRFGASGPMLQPRLPQSWRRLELTVAWRGRRYDLATRGSPQHDSEARP